VDIVLTLLAVVTIFLLWALRTEYPKSVKTTGVIGKPFQKITSHPPTTLHVMTYNIAYAAGLKNLAGHVSTKKEILSNLDAISETIKRQKVDIACIQEIDIKSRRTYNIDQVNYLAEKCGLPYTAYTVNWDKRWVPYPINLEIKSHFGKIVSGQAVLSKYPITTQKVITFPKPKSNWFWYNWFYLDRAAQYVTLSLDKDFEITLCNIHLEFRDLKARLSQVNAILNNYKENQYKNFILAGDFNTIPRWATVKNGFRDEPKTDFTADTSYAQILTVDPLAPVFTQTNYKENETGLHNFPANAPTRKLDHIFVDKQSFSVVRSEVVQAGTASDHLPVFAELKRL